MATLALASKDLHRLLDDGTLAARPDAQLLAAFVSRRDESAFAAVVARHGPMVLGTCRAVLKDPHAAEDAFQATFLILARKATHLRGGESLGGWLHRVAVRVSVELNRSSTRRRRVEGEAAAARPAGLEPDDPAAAEIRALVQAEVNRLPDGLRLPIVLCDLGGLTREQAARELRWTEGTVRGRLARGRSLLRDRLARRGLALPAALGLRPPLPPTWALATARAAAGKAPKAAVLWLAGRMARRAFVARTTLTATAVLATGLVVWGASVIVHGPNRDPDSPSPHAPATRARAALAVAGIDDEEKPDLQYRGRVADPVGKPVEGASEAVIVWTRNSGSVPVGARTGVDGRFAFSIPLKRFGDEVAARYRRVLASAPGYGVGLTDDLAPDAGRELTLRLVEDLPIEGRVVDLEGRPVANAKVWVSCLWANPRGGLDAWLDAIGRKEQNLQTLNSTYFALRIPLPARAPGIIAPATTDASGRFTIRGVGRERLAELRVEGPGIRVTIAPVMTRLGGPTRAVTNPDDADEPRRVTIYDARPTLVVGPSRPVVGVIRDGTTGAPVSGARIAVTRFPPGVWGYQFEAPEAVTTGDDGRYRIDGLAPVAGYEFQVAPPERSPYLPSIVRPDNPPGLAPVVADIGLARGVVVSGRVADSVSGKPLQATVTYHAERENPNLEASPGFRELGRLGYELRVWTGSDGTFRVACLPGRGVLVTEVLDRDYPFPEEFERIQETGRYLPEPGATHTLSPVDLTPGREPIPVEIKARRGLVIPGSIVAPDGKPLENVFTSGLAGPTGDFWDSQTLSGSSFHAQGLFPSPGDGPIKPQHLLVFTHPGRQLAGWAALTGAEASPLVVKTASWATVTGRLVDEEGRPHAGVLLNVRMRVPPGDLPISAAQFGPRVQTDADGRFRIEGAVAGLVYRILPKLPGAEVIPLGIPRPGETLDAGDVVFKPKEGG